MIFSLITSQRMWSNQDGKSDQFNQPGGIFTGFHLGEIEPGTLAALIWTRHKEVLKGKLLIGTMKLDHHALWSQASWKFSLPLQTISTLENMEILLLD